ncbi:hypothetical protein T09_8840 [Trichinella sp. T9]|nr:hypothetical protein T09_8840 [Trichinella sp. T9]
MSSIISKRENGFREALPHGVVVLAEPLTHCLLLYS